MATAIYAIVNNITRDMYVGSSVAVNRRWATHRRDLARKTHYNSRLQRAFDKYGNAAFDWEIVQIVTDRNKLIEREQFWINFFQPVYNGRPNASSPLGTRHSAETRVKMSISAKKRGFSEEHKRNISLAKKGISTITDAQRRRLSELGKVKVFSEETRAKISAAGKGNRRAAGKQYSDAERAEISARMKAWWAARKQSTEESQ